MLCKFHIDGTCLANKFYQTLYKPPLIIS